jgi:hypothetical protein
MRDTYPKSIYGCEPLAEAEINDLASSRVKATIRKKENDTYNKKNEIYQLREQVNDLQLLVQMLVADGNIGATLK